MTRASRIIAGAALAVVPIAMLASASSSGISVALFGTIVAIDVLLAITGLLRPIGGHALPTRAVIAAWIAVGAAAGIAVFYVGDDATGLASPLTRLLGVVIPRNYGWYAYAPDSGTTFEPTSVIDASSAASLLVCLSLMLATAWLLVEWILVRARRRAASV